MIMQTTKEVYQDIFNKIYLIMADRLFCRVFERYVYTTSNKDMRVFLERLQAICEAEATPETRHGMFVQCAKDYNLYIPNTL